MKKTVIALQMHKGELTFGGQKIHSVLPPGCIGVCFVFESKKVAREYWGKGVSLREIEIETQKSE